MAQPAAADSLYHRGDTIEHTTRPQWGIGCVQQAQPVIRDGVTTQRIVVDFPHKGRVTLDTATAPIRRFNPATQRTPTPTPTPNTQDTKSMTTSGSALHNNKGGWLAELESKANGGKQTHELWDLPDALSDPFLPDEARLKATLDTYQYSTDARSLIAWAIMQTGLQDPLSKYTRTDMEMAFPRFARDRDNHLKDMIRQLKREGRHALIQQLRNHCQIPAAVSAIDRAMRA